MENETAAVAVAQYGEIQNTEVALVALTAVPDTDAYNTVIEMLKSRELERSVTQLGLLESVTRPMHYSGPNVSVPYYSAHCDYQVQLLWTWTVGRTEDWLRVY